MKKLFAWVVIILIGFVGYVGLRSWINRNNANNADNSSSQWVRVTYKVDDVVYETKTYPKGNRVYLDMLEDAPETETHYYQGWMYESGEKVINDFFIQNDVTLVANKVAKAVVKEKKDGEVVETRYFKHGEKVLLELEPETETHYYDSWQIEGSDEIFTEFPVEITVNEDMTFVTNKIAKAVVKAKKDGEVIQTLYFKHGEKALLELEPETETHYYPSWQLEGSDEVFTEYPVEFTVNGDMTFVTNKVAKAVVKVKKDGEVTQTLYVKHGEQVTLKLPAETETHYYDSWQLEESGEVFTKSSVKITVNEDMTFVTNKLPKSLVTYMVNGDTYKTEYLKPANKKLLWLDDTSTMAFIGWKVNGTGDTIKKSDYYKINQDVTFVAEFAERDWVDTTWYGLTDFGGKYVWKYTQDGINYKYYYNAFAPGQSYELEVQTKTWRKKTWNGLSYFNGNEVKSWKEGNKYRCCYFGDLDSGVYELNGDTWTINETLTSLFSPVAYDVSDGDISNSIWYDNQNYYLLGKYNTYKYQNDQWEKIDATLLFEGIEEVKISRSQIWTDGTSWYYEKSGYENEHYKRADNGFWYPVNNVLCTPVSARLTINDELYCIIDGNLYIFNKTNETWDKTEWVGPGPAYPAFIWTDDTNVYYSKGSQQYMLNIKS